MSELILLILSGGLVGFAIGLTGVGGGSLMTPVLLLFGYPPPVAIGTDLLYAAFTKAGGVFFHHGKKNIQWRTMLLLSLGSIPVSLALMLLVLDESLLSSPAFGVFLTMALGFMLIITSVVIIFQKRIQRRLAAEQKTPPQQAATAAQLGYARRHTALMTLALGILLGCCVTLTSVGAGALGAAVLFLLYPRWKTTSVVGTDIAHAVPLTFVAGIGYFLNGLVDLKLLLGLLCGSLPGIYLGTNAGAFFPDKVMRSVLAITLLGLGLYFILSP